MSISFPFLNPLHPRTEHADRLIRKCLSLIENHDGFERAIPIITQLVVAMRLLDYASFFDLKRRECRIEGRRATNDPLFGTIDEISARVVSIELSTRAGCQIALAVMMVVIPLLVAMKFFDCL
ncbi:MAG: hypothetical protein KDK55_01475 [Chlamydiia bacterium]|nr:hypothetical protein [Chlamydiia bacterium]